jgi:hypothetical protein
MRPFRCCVVALRSATPQAIAFFPGRPQSHHALHPVQHYRKTPIESYVARVDASYGKMSDFLRRMGKQVTNWHFAESGQEAKKIERIHVKNRR